VRVRVPRVAGCKDALLAVGAVDRHDVKVRPADVVGSDPARDDGGPVRGDVEDLLDEARPGGRCQVDGVADPLLARRQWRGEEMPLPWAVERIPVTDGEGVEQERLHAGLLPGLVALAVGDRIGRAREDGRGVDDDVGLAGGHDGIDTSRRRRQEPGLATSRGKQPQAAYLLVFVPVIGRAIRVGPGGGEEDGAVAGEGGGALAGRRARQAPRPIVPCRVDLP
jgi:hypothetical protein